MRLWLVSHLVESPGNRLFLEAAMRAGHQVQHVRPDELSLTFEPGVSPGLHGPAGPLALPELAFTRMGSSAPAEAWDALRQLEAAGVRTINSSAGLALARDKLRTFQLLASSGLPLPRTVQAAPGAFPGDLLEFLGPAPWIVKERVSTQGHGVSLVESRADLSAALERAAQRPLVQRFVAGAGGSDLRVLVLGGRAVAAMRRQGAPGEVRSNLHQGGTAEAVELTPELRELAERAATALGLQVAGVDLLPDGEQLWICEVNGSPGLEGLGRATGRDLAAEVLTYLESVQGSNRMG